MFKRSLYLLTGIAILALLVGCGTKRSVISMAVTDGQLNYNETTGGSFRWSSNLTEASQSHVRVLDAQGKKLLINEKGRLLAAYRQNPSAYDSQIIGSLLGLNFPNTLTIKNHKNRPVKARIEKNELIREEITVKAKDVVYIKVGETIVASFLDANGKWTEPQEITITAQKGGGNRTIDINDRVNR